MSLFSKESGWETAEDGFMFRRKASTQSNNSKIKSTSQNHQLGSHTDAPHPTAANKSSAPSIVARRRHTVNWMQDSKTTTLKSRRSSIDLRGKRISAAHNGLCAAPHDSIDSSQFYRHIDAGQPDPVRMRQLLIWCGERAMASSMVDSTVDEQELQKRLEQQRKVIDLLTAKKIDVSWYGRPKGDAKKAVNIADLPPHPLNESNKRKIAKLEQCLKSLTKEGEEWTSLFSSLDSREAALEAQLAEWQSIADMPDKTQALDYAEASVDSSKLDPLKLSHIEAWNASTDEDEAFQTWVTDVKVDIKCNLHRLQSALSQSLGHDQLYTAGFCDVLSARMLRAYAERERKEMGNVGEPMDLLRMLSAGGN